MASETHMSTCGKSMTVLTQWIPHSRAEITDAQCKCAEEKERQQEVVAEQKQVKAERWQMAKKKVAAQEDANAKEDREIQSLRPDIILMKKGLPSFQAQPPKQTRKKVYPTDVLPRAVTPVIESPPGAFAVLPEDEEAFALAYNVDSAEDLPPMSTAATSESEGPIDDIMDVDVQSESEPNVLVADKVVAMNDSSDDDYVPKESDSEGEDEQALFKEFMAQRRKAKLAGSMEQTVSVPSELKADIATAKTLSKTKTAVNKLEVRQGITDLHTIAPMPAIHPMPVKKRPSQASEQDDLYEICTLAMAFTRMKQSAKHLKSESIGGLITNWQKVYKGSDPSTSVTSLATSNGGDEVQEITESPTPGEFAEDESADAVKNARKAKNRSQTDGKGSKVDKKSITVKLELENVNEIDGKECGKVKGRKSAWKFEDLPLPSASDVKLFKQKVVVPILDWSAMLEGQFSTNNHSELKPTVAVLWNSAFGHLPKHLNNDKKQLRVDHPAIIGILMFVQIQTQIWCHRSELGKAAMAAIYRNWKHPDLKGCKTAEQHAEWVKNAMKNKWFVYDKPENTTMAYHIQCMLSTPTMFGPPAGALALAAAAVVKRALQAWKKGVNSLDGKQSKNSLESFGEDPWATVVKQHFKNMSTLSTNKWNEIYLHCREFSSGGKGDDGEDSDDEDDDDSDDVDMSE
ncbi:uncharacterized protein EV420DRAFT_1486398 [Desarmillaria tabescens]|uniref:Uncharacterized protein n=1 Tax=Armillaria tabescens TaxID=1929756 RepID=A0AA39JCJ2_ARMTA|nr:uncharacterized protein EV420DRAFT_1486398 [Desarmillaria tabescens]KAK0439301.1 hypothetical protein EV420DRAFT_1486398 [Desarmillaria tabescens]